MTCDNEMDFRAGSSVSQTSSVSDRDAIMAKKIPPDKPKITKMEAKFSLLNYLSKYICCILTFTIATAVTLTHFVNMKVSKPEISTGLTASLRETYNVDYDNLLEERKRNMKKYSYPYKMNGVDKRSQLSLQEFNDVYNGKWPVVITDVISSWPASNWTPEFFLQKYPNDKVTIKTVNGCLEKAVSVALPLHVFHRYSERVSPDRWAYVEDELFIPMRPELQSDLGQTVYLEEDYFRLWPEEVRPWNAMLLWGTAYSRSSLHIDPYNWTGTNAVISGRKLWKLYQPGQDQNLYVKQNQRSGFPLDAYKYNSPIDAWDPDLQRFPLFKQVRAIDLEQLPGELLIIPFGWFHQAFNPEETIAVSSQVMNSYNWRIVMEEIIKIGDNVQRHLLPSDTDKLSPKEQVEKVMFMLPPHILEHGKSVTRNILHQMQHGADDEYDITL